MRDSIGWTSHGNEGHVGSNNDKAVWDELGTARVPPRPFLQGAARAMEGKIHKMAGEATLTVLAGRGLRAAALADLFSALRQANHVAGQVRQVVRGVAKIIP